MAVRHDNNSLGMDLSNCKSILVLWDKGYSLMTWNLIAPTACSMDHSVMTLGGHGGGEGTGDGGVTSVVPRIKAELHIA